MIDFDALVLAPNMDVFAQDVSIDPRASQPFVPPYQARGIWIERPVDVELADGRILSSAEKILGVRCAEFGTVPCQGDVVTRGAVVFMIEDVDYDGQGGAMLTLKEIKA
jgi:hypothetical protein